MYTGNVADAFGAPDASAYATLPLPAGAAVQTHGYIVPSDAYALASYQEQIVRDHALYVQPEQHAHELQAANNANNTHNDAAPGASVTVDVQKNNQDQIAALVSSRDREVTQLQTTLAMPLAHFNAKFIWHCIMNIEQDCEYVVFLFSSFQSPIPRRPPSSTVPREMCDIVALGTGLGYHATNGIASSGPMP